MKSASRTPLYKGDLLVARPEGMGFRLELLASREAFHAWLLEYAPIARELPSYSDFQECMLASGIVDYTNRAAFDEMLTSYEQLKKAVFFGLDTNLFYHCFVTNNPEINHASYLIVDTVRDEITYAINRKYPGKDDRGDDGVCSRPPGLHRGAREQTYETVQESSIPRPERVPHHP